MNRERRPSIFAIVVFLVFAASLSVIALKLFKPQGSSPSSADVFGVPRSELATADDFNEAFQKINEGLMIRTSEELGLTESEISALIDRELDSPEYVTGVSEDELVQLSSTLKHLEHISAQLPGASIVDPVERGRFLDSLQLPDTVSRFTFDLLLQSELTKRTALIEEMKEVNSQSLEERRVEERKLFLPFAKAEVIRDVICDRADTLGLVVPDQIDGYFIDHSLRCEFASRMYVERLLTRELSDDTLLREKILEAAYLSRNPLPLR